MEITQINIKKNDLTKLKSGWKNQIGTQNLSCNCQSWKEHWLKFSGEKEWPELCSVQGCNRIAKYGGHVCNVFTDVSCIVPICSSCNQKNIVFELKEGTKFADANPLYTCNNYLKHWII